METLRKTRRSSAAPYEHFITIREAARVMGMSQVKALRLALANTFGPPLSVGKHTYVDGRRVDAYLRQSPTGTT